MADNQIQEYFDSLQSVSKLVGDLALSIADAQGRLDDQFMKSLGQFGAVLQNTVQTTDLSAEQFTALFKSLAPSRYQFTETVVEVRADLQMTSATEFGGSVEIGVNTPVLAATVNASYSKRSAYDYRAAALIKTILHAVPPDLDMAKMLLERAANVDKVELPEGGRYAAFAEAIKGVLPVASTPAKKTGAAKKTGGAGGDDG